MYYFQGFDASDAIKAVLNWAMEHPDFDTSFVESLSEKYEEYGQLTERQSEALENIVDKFNIDISENL